MGAAKVDDLLNMKQLETKSDWGVLLAEADQKDLAYFGRQDNNR